MSVHSLEEIDCLLLSTADDISDIFVDAAELNRFVGQEGSLRFLTLTVRNLVPLLPCVPRLRRSSRRRAGESGG
jgi:hypothetical protein